MNLCSSCNAESTGHFCSNCGQLLVIERIDKNYAIQELTKLTGYEKGCIYTVKELARRPGLAIREYLEVDRQKMTKPITFLILASLIYTFIAHYFKTDAIHTSMLKMVYGDSSVYKLSIWVQNNYGYANLLMLIPITLWTKFLFNDFKYNSYETFVMTSFIMAEGMLLYTLQVVLNYCFPSFILLNEFATGVVLFFYVSWGIGQFYGGTKGNYFKAFLSYIIGTISFQVGIVVLGTLIDLIFKK